jgi:hypothetical protein
MSHGFCMQGMNFYALVRCEVMAGFFRVTAGGPELAASVFPK